eukprot:10161453-Heterocapsa_arctica.AAC.1
MVKERLTHLKTLVGLHSTYCHEESILIEITHPEAAHKVQELTEDAALVSPTLMLARSTASEAQWIQKVDG